MVADARLDAQNLSFVGCPTTTPDLFDTMYSIACLETCAPYVPNASPVTYQTIPEAGNGNANDWLPISIPNENECVVLVSGEVAYAPFAPFAGERMSQA